MWTQASAPPTAEYPRPWSHKVHTVSADWKGVSLPPRGSPKTDHRGSLQNRPTINITRDVDLDSRANSLGQHEQCLERRKEAASHSVGTAGRVPAKDPEGDRSPPDHRG